MPVYSLEGTPGSGKTLYCVQKIIPEFLKVRDYRGELVPRHIYTNIEGLKPELICSYCGVPYEAIAEYFHVLGQAVDENGRTYEDKDLVRWWFYEPWSIEWLERQNANRQVERYPDPEKAVQIPNGSLVIIDEVQNYYSNRDFATFYSKACIDFITKNRHFGWTLWWMSQSVESVDVTFRRNTQYVYFLERKENYGNANASSVKMYEGWLAGNKTNIEPFAKASFAFDKRYFNCYKSYVDGVSGEKRYKTNIWLNHKGFVLVVVLFIVALLAAIIINPFDTIAGVTKKHTAPTTHTATPPPTPISFSGSAGAGVVEHRQSNYGSSNDSLCAMNYFVMNGAPYVVFSNGKTRKLKGGEHYVECE